MLASFLFGMSIFKVFLGVVVERQRDLGRFGWFGSFEAMFGD